MIWEMVLINVYVRIASGGIKKSLKAMGQIYDKIEEAAEAVRHEVSIGYRFNLFHIPAGYGVLVITPLLLTWTAVPGNNKKSGGNDI